MVRRVQSVKVYDIPAADAGRQLGVPAETIKRWAREGRLDGRKLKMSGKWVFAKEDLDAIDVRAVVVGD